MNNIINVQFAINNKKRERDILEDITEIDENDIKRIMIEYESEMFIVNSIERINNLNLSWLKHEKYITEDQWKAMIKYLRIDKTITFLNLAGNDQIMQMTHMNQLLKLLEYNKILNTLDLTRVIPSSLNKMIPQLLKNKSLKILNLSECGMTIQEMKELTDALKYNDTLNSIFLYNTLFNMQHCFNYFVECLEINQTLTQLGLVHMERLKQSEKEEPLLKIIETKLEINRVFKQQLINIQVTMLMIQRRKGSILSLIPRRLLIYLMTFIRK